MINRSQFNSLVRHSYEKVMQNESIFNRIKSAVKGVIPKLTRAIAPLNVLPANSMHLLYQDIQECHFSEDEIKRLSPEDLSVFQECKAIIENKNEIPFLKNKAKLELEIIKLKLEMPLEALEHLEFIADHESEVTALLEQQKYEDKCYGNLLLDSLSEYPSQAELIDVGFERIPFKDENLSVMVKRDEFTDRIRSICLVLHPEYMINNAKSCDIKDQPDFNKLCSKNISKYGSGELISFLKENYTHVHASLVAEDQGPVFTDEEQQLEIIGTDDDILSQLDDHHYYQQLIDNGYDYKPTKTGLELELYSKENGAEQQNILVISPHFMIDGHSISEYSADSTLDGAITNLFYQNLLLNGTHRDDVIKLKIDSCVYLDDGACLQAESNHNKNRVHALYEAPGITVNPYSKPTSKPPLQPQQKINQNIGFDFKGIEQRLKASMAATAAATQNRANMARQKLNETTQRQNQERARIQRENNSRQQQRQREQAKFDSKSRLATGQKPINPGRVNQPITSKQQSKLNAGPISLTSTSLGRTNVSLSSVPKISVNIKSAKSNLGVRTFNQYFTNPNSISPRSITNFTARVEEKKSYQARVNQANAIVHNTSEATLHIKSVVSSIAYTVLQRENRYQTPGKVTGGNSTDLGKNILKSQGVTKDHTHYYNVQTNTWKGYQAHHIIPSQLKTHDALVKVGFNLDHYTNGRMLPSTKNKPVASAASGKNPTDHVISATSRHTGPHAGYNAFVERELDKIDLKRPLPEIQKSIAAIQTKLDRVLSQGISIRSNDGVSGTDTVAYADKKTGFNLDTFTRFYNNA